MTSLDAWSLPSLHLHLNLFLLQSVIRPSSCPPPLFSSPFLHWHHPHRPFPSPISEIRAENWRPKFEMEKCMGKMERAEKKKGERREVWVIGGSSNWGTSWDDDWFERTGAGRWVEFHRLFLFCNGLARMLNGAFVPYKISTAHYAL